MSSHPGESGLMTVDEAPSSETEPSSTTDDVAGTRRLPRGWLLILLLGFTLVPFAVLAIAQAVRGWNWHTAGDLSTMEFRIRDIGSSDTPLVGPYSRWGWNHPGPMIFYIMGVPYRLLGSRSAGLIVGAVLSGAAAVAASLVLAWRRGGRLLATLTAFAFLAFFVAHAALIRAPWNPMFGMLPLFVVMLAAWSLACGDRLGLPLMAAGATVAAQSHALYIVPVGCLIVWGLGWMAWECRHPEGRRSWRGPLVATAVIVVLTWSPVAVEQFTNHPGNVTKIIGFNTSGAKPPSIGLSRAAGIAAAAFRPWGSLATAYVDGVDPHPRGSLPLLLLPVAGVIGIALVGRFRGRHDLLLLAGTIGVLLVSSVVALASIYGVVYQYLYVWVWVASLFVWLGVAWVLALEIATRTPDRARRGIVAASLPALAVLSLVAVASSITTDLPGAAWRTSDAVEAVMPQVEAAIPDGASVAINPIGVEFIGRREAIAVALEKFGHRIVMPADLGWKWGESRVGDPSKADVHLVVGDGKLADKPPGPGFRRIAFWSPLTAGERKEEDQLAAAIRTRLTQLSRGDLVGTVTDPGSVDRLKKVANLNQTQVARLITLVKADQNRLGVFAETRP